MQYFPPATSPLNPLGTGTSKALARYAHVSEGDQVLVLTNLGWEKVGVKKKHGNGKLGKVTGGHVCEGDFFQLLP